MGKNLKRNGAILTMGLLVCGAAVLNWTYTGDVGTQVAEETSRIAGETTLVSSQEGDLTTVESQEETDVVPTSSDYFATARLTRQQARDSAVSLLQEAAAQEGADEAVANQASESIQVLASFTLAETQIENLVTAKGYADCVAFMGEESVSIVVSTEDGALSASDVAKISDITMTETGYSPEQIKIVATK